MEKTYTLYGHAPSKQSKILKLEYSNKNLGIYNIITKWEGCPSLDNYCQLSYDITPNGKKLKAIDFDGGPMLSAGSYISGRTRVVDFLHDDDLSNIKVVLEECNF